MGTLLLNKWTHVYLLMKYIGRSPIFYFWAFNVTVARCSIQCDSWFCFCYYSTFQINDALRSLIVTSVFWRFVEPVGLPLEKMSGIKCRNSEAYRRCKHLHYCRLFEILGSCCFFDVMFTQVFLSVFLFCRNCCSNSMWFLVLLVICINYALRLFKICLEDFLSLLGYHMQYKRLQWTYSRRVLFWILFLSPHTPCRTWNTQKIWGKWLWATIKQTQFRLIAICLIFFVAHINNLFHYQSENSCVH